MKHLLLFPLLFLLFIGCTESDKPDSNDFRGIYKNTFWKNEDLGIITFTSDKLFYLSDPVTKSCFFWEEGSFNKVEYDGCTYDNTTYVVIKEEKDIFQLREITSSGRTSRGTFCSGEETTLVFKVINDKVMEISFTYPGFGTDTYTLSKVNSSFPTSGCKNGTLNDFLW